VRRTMAASPYFIDVKARKAKEMAAGVRTRTFWKEKMLMSLVELDPNSDVAMHTHAEEQCGYVTKGTIEMVIEKERRLLKEGDLYHIPANVPHSAKAGPKGATVLDVFSPLRQVLQY
jgi:quercetin dioxygenase-like cupin family protein